MAGLTTFLFYSCTLNDNNYSISGTLDNATGKNLYLYEMTTYDLNPVDSVIVADNGKFLFNGEIDQVRFMSIRKDQRNYLTLIVFPGDDIEITADYNKLKETATIKGSRESKLALKLNREMHYTLMKLDSLAKNYQSSLDKPGTDFDLLRQRTRDSFEEIAEEQRQFTIDFITRNTGSLSTMIALYHQIDPRTFVLQQEEDFRYYVLVDSVLFEKYPDLDYTITLNENVRDMMTQIEHRKQRERLLGAGAIAPEISLPDPAGDTINLSSLRGKYVLLDFWAAWCGPCREENPYLLKNYNKFNDQGFEIYQVSLDRSRDAWIKGIEEDNLNRWTHVSDLQFWSSVVVPLYNIEGIPANFLLDPEGKILAKDLRGESLGHALTELFN